jgi:hypothetical protein
MQMFAHCYKLSEVACFIVIYYISIFQVCKRSLDNMPMFDSLTQVNTLKEQVTLAVEDAVCIFL